MFPENINYPLRNRELKLGLRNHLYYGNCGDFRPEKFKTSCRNNLFRALPDM